MGVLAALAADPVAHRWLQIENLDPEEVAGAITVMAVALLPILIGARDVAFPRLNLTSWYLFIAGALLAVLSLFTGGGAPDTGWTFYAPFSIQTGTNVSLAVLAAFVLGFSSILTGLPRLLRVQDASTIPDRPYRSRKT